ncbi:uncharacterized protein PAC_18955 [Phialocephala subalpina]|uniref:Reverse transcriptase domain-containing protein n=1 Tax=Phialocephala subalpina TaxID=576137 RepID=A0A1L7XVH4_9HELO|nr:uncharacterized protein PAC_18955 [Phialocephala subalpina]
MSSSTAALSRTLKTITLTKINELEKQRKAYAHSKNAILKVADEAPHQRERVLRLLEGVEGLNQISSSPSADLSNIRRWLFQSHYDSSVPENMLNDFEAQLRAQLNIRTRRLDLGRLYSRLLTEWLDSSNAIEEEPVIEETECLDESFEVIEKDRLKQLTEKFESVVFTPLETDPVEIHEYLDSLFQGDIGDKTLTRLREATHNKGVHILRHKTVFDESTIKWCLEGLLANDLLRDDKKAILQEFLQDEVARKEICDVLNMKFVDLDNWTWDVGPDGLPVEQRRQLNGKYRIMMDEDVLDAIFLHYIGMSWSVGMKSILCEIGDRPGFWKHHVNIPQKVKDCRRYFLGEYRFGEEAGGSVEKARQDMYRKDFFLSQLPSSVTEGSGGYDDEDDAESDGWDAVPSNPGKKSPKQVKQQLLRIMATEVELQKSINGRVAVVQSDFQWFGTSISHSSIYAVLRFVGMDEKWISFFRKFLEAPLNMGPVSDQDEQVRIRKRGVPMAHALEKFFGELVLFFMDLAVNQEAAMLLYRFHDDLWLVGEPERCTRAWETMQQFSTVMGLELNKSKTGSVFLTKEDELSYEDSELVARLPVGPVAIGFLNLDPESTDWVIDQKQVDAHVRQLSKQLAKAPNVLSWVQTWNSCIGRFFSHTFGEPANCFGRAHVDGILETYKRMQDDIFPGSNACKYLKGLIEERFSVTDIPDAFIFLPESLGGLGVRNPFISPFLVRDNVCESPSKLMEGFLKREAEAYHTCKREFEELSPQGRKRRLRIIYTDEYGEGDPSAVLEDADTFMSMKEFISVRESTSPELHSAWEELMEVPHKKEIVASSEVMQSLRSLTFSQPELRGNGMESEIRWILQMHEKELTEKCGGTSIVEKNLLPLGILTILRKKKVAWQMVL